MGNMIKRIIAKAPLGTGGYYWQVYENGHLVVQSGGDFKTREKCEENFKWVFKSLEASLLKQWEGIKS